jgi:hypothetical protein
MDTTAQNGKWTTHLAAQLCAAAMLACLALGARAQTPAPVSAEAQAVSVDQAVAAAQQWLAMADANQAAAMWEQSSPLMKAKVDRAYWLNHIATMRNNLGQVSGTRTWTRMDQAFNAPNLPAGRFMGIHFITPFSKSPRVVEIVSLVWEGGRWVCVGYQFAPVAVPEQSPAVPAQ